MTHWGAVVPNKTNKQTKMPFKAQVIFSALIASVYVL
jgi:hypothetical protein